MYQILLFLVACVFLPFSVCASEPLRQEEDGLAVALHLTLTEHPTIKNKIAELKASGFDLESAEALRYPSLSLQASTTSAVSGNTSNSSGDRYHAVVAVLKQPLWAGGKIDNSIEQAQIKLKSVNLSLLEAYRELMEGTSASYAAVIGARKRLDAAELNVTEHERLKELIERRATGGVASLADAQLARSRQSQAQAQKIQLMAALQTALYELHSFTQQPISAHENIQPDFLELPEQDQMLPQAEKMSVLVQQRTIDVELSKNSRELAKASMMPNLYVKLEQDVYTASNQGEIPQGTRVGVFLEGAVEGMGFLGLKRISSSESRVMAAQRNVEAARNDVRRQIQTLVNDLKSLLLIVDSYLFLVQSTEQTLASFLRQYDAGRKSWVDVLNIQRELSDARLNHEQSKAAMQEKRLRLAVRLGQFDKLVGGH